MERIKKELELPVDVREEYAARLFERIKKKELEFSEPLPPPKKRRHACYYRIISYSLQKVLTGYPECELKMTPIMTSTGQQYELHWVIAGRLAGLVVGNREDCEKGLKFIEKFIEELKSQDVKNKAENLHQNAEKLNNERKKFREMLHFKIIDNIGVGGIIKGRCDACKEEKLSR